MTPLDVALLLGDTPVARVLQHHGAVESMRCELVELVDTVCTSMHGTHDQH